MPLEWVRNPVTGSFRAEVTGRSFLAEHTLDGWDVWYGVPNRRLRVGANLRTLTEAQFLAEDLLAGILKNNRITGE